jgi:hypothetical protein
MLYSVQGVQQMLRGVYCNAFSLKDFHLTLMNTKGSLKARGIDKLLDEAREDNKENDVVYMEGKKCKPATRPPNLTFG